MRLSGEQKLDARQKLELKIKQLQGKLEVMKHMPGEEDLESKRKIHELTGELQEKYDEINEMESLHGVLLMKERMSNDELQDARKKLKDVSWMSHLSSILFQHLLVV